MEGEVLIREGKMEGGDGGGGAHKEGLKTHSEGLLSRFLESKAWSSLVLGERCWHFYVFIFPLLFIQQLIPPIETLRTRKREGEGEGDTHVLLLSCGGSCHLVWSQQVRHKEGHTANHLIPTKEESRVQLLYVWYMVATCEVHGGHV